MSALQNVRIVSPIRSFCYELRIDLFDYSSNKMRLNKTFLKRNTGCCLRFTKGGEISGFEWLSDSKRISWSMKGDGITIRNARGASECTVLS